MAYINVAEWTPDQVTDWLKGLDDSMYNYIYSFTNNEVGGQQLLNIRPYELEQLGMHSIGHQEIVLEAVEHLRNFHYNLDKENLQFLALHVATAARSLYKQLAYYCDNSKIETQILNDITRTIATIKPVISWLDRSPFQGQLQFNEVRRNMLRLGLEMATSAQRDRFVENPVEQIRMSAEKLANLADYIIQDITDPMLLQPASLNLVTLKKRESDLGFNIVPSYHGIHRVSDIKYNSPAHNSGKIEDGDEIVQINYQTVVGWQYKTVILQLRESPPDVLLTLKKRPKHTKIYGQIYMQPYRLPSKKRAAPGRWGENLPSPRADFLAVPDFNLPLKMTEKHTTSDSDSSCSDILTPTDSKSADKEFRLYMPKPRAVLQRRNTICGDELSCFKNVGNVPLWHERKSGQNGDPSSPSLRDKSVSFGFGLEITPRPTTCLGITGNGKFSDKIGLNNSLPEIPSDKPPSESEKVENEEKSKPGVSKVVRFGSDMKYDDYPADNKYICNVDNTILETFEPIPYVDEEDVVVEEKKTPPKIVKETIQITEPVQAINMMCIQPIRRGRLDKSHSTPAYDNSGDDSDTPPAIEPRKEFLQTTPPAPPPRPKRHSDVQPPTIPPPPPKPQALSHSEKCGTSPATTKSVIAAPNVPSPVHFLQSNVEETELLTPTKTKSLTLKKKNSLIAKRRKISLKVLGTGDIQGHLYRRTKDKRGVTFWAKLYFVLFETVLYGFRTKDAQKASCMVFLPGFTVSIAKEVHSKPHAFRVYHHTSKTFYFAAESTEALNQWMEFIRQATLKDKPANAESSIENNKDFFSETDSSGDESGPKHFSTPSPSSTLGTSSGSRDASFKAPDTPTNSKHEKYFESLKKFTKTNLPFKSTEKKPSSDIPVPTPQFRSYRKVPGGSYGLQIGTNSSAYPDNTSTLHYFLEISSKESALQHSEDSKQSSLSDFEENHSKDSKESLNKPKKIRKTSPYNYIHASNPNLVEFDFHTSKSLDFSLPKINPSNSWDAHNNLQGFVTLKDLMLRKQEEEAQEMYNNRVFLGVEKDERNSRYLYRRGHHDEGHNASGTGKLSKIQSRSLPKTPDDDMSFKPDDEDIKRTRTKEGLKLRDFGYELIHGDEPVSGNHKQDKNSNVHHSSKKKHSIGSVFEIGDKTSRAGSFKKTKGKFEAFKTSSEKLFQFKHSNSDGDSKSLKSTSSYSPMTLPLNKKSSLLYGSQMEHCGSQGNIKKSHTYNSDLKDKRMDAPRKNSAPMPILSKFAFSASKTPKEKKLLGSPRLHRAIFGRTTSGGSTHSDFDHEAFSPITFVKPVQIAPESTVDPQIGAPIAPSEKIPPITVTPEYPNMECPPVFEPETYSLSDPNASLTLLRRRNNLEEK